MRFRAADEGVEEERFGVTTVGRVEDVRSQLLELLAQAKIAGDRRAARIVRRHHRIDQVEQEAVPLRLRELARLHAVADVGEIALQADQHTVPIGECLQTFGAFGIEVGHAAVGQTSAQGLDFGRCRSLFASAAFKTPGNLLIR